MTGDHLDDLRTTLRTLLAAHAPLARVRTTALAGKPRDEGVWNRLVAEVGVAGLPFAEVDGGAGGGQRELVVLLEETGAVLLDQPLFSTVALAGQLVAETVSGPARTQLLPLLAGGAARSTVAVGDDGEPLTELELADGRLTGTVLRVPEAARSTEVLVVLAGGCVVRVDLDQPGVTLRPTDALDPTRPCADVVFDGAAAEVLAENATDGLARWRRLAVLANGAEQAGVCRAALTMAVEYAKLRVQFDKPIGAQQAIQHLLAGVLAGTVGAEAAVRLAAAAVDEGRSDAAELVAVAAAHAAETAVSATKALIQVHGGIGFTWEHDAHLLYRRALASAAFFGGAAARRRELATVLQI
ncbi:acyl-CoA dehydrogenase family protein [Sporichthya polymorpha]|uniref:acyl-CoA dehydrogenase family protein n=1 Tax=Sporichthya polymorpha TaxID=35751 RepID=UPI000378B3DA|nr:acyl-CoA dehydrogenase family protein [Sporichthya polymorpha]